MKTEEEGNKQEVAKGRKRKKSFKVDVQETSDVTGEAVDTVTATIEAVLANASAITTTFEKPKKAKRVKKRDQEGNVAKIRKDAETTADDVEENDDDSSTAGHDLFCKWGSTLCNGNCKAMIYKNKVILNLIVFILFNRWISTEKGCN